MKRATIGFACAFAFAAMLGLAACSAQAPSSEASDEAPAPEAAIDLADTAGNSPYCLVSTHPQQLSGEPNTDYCLTCHDYEKLAADSAKSPLDEGGKTVFNPHAGHVDFECVDCHSVSEAPVLQCNSCHYITGGEGWTDPEDGAKAMFVDPGTIYGDLGYGTSGDSYAMGAGAGLGMNGAE